MSPNPAPPAGTASLAVAGLFDDAAAGDIRDMPPPAGDERDIPPAWRRAGDDLLMLLPPLTKDIV